MPQTFKYETFPLQRNQILLRVENVGDLFDTTYKGLTIQDTSITVDLKDWAQKFIATANTKPVAVKEILISELALSGN